jgi:hypothetical protein
MIINRGYLSGNIAVRGYLGTGVVGETIRIISYISRFVAKSNFLNTADSFNFSLSNSASRTSIFKRFDSLSFAYVKNLFADLDFINTMTKIVHLKQTSDNDIILDNSRDIILSLSNTNTENINLSQNKNDSVAVSNTVQRRSGAWNG